MAENLIPVEESQEFFRSIVEGVVKKRNYSVSHPVQWYLVALLSRYVRAEKLHRLGEEDFFSQPFAIRLLQTELSGKGGEAVMTLKHLGDATLYLTGYFSDHFKAEPTGIDYYAKLGATAYTRLATFLKGSPEQGEAIFSELSEKFPCLVDILSEISAEHQLTSSSDILQIYERWLMTKSSRLKSWLETRGVFLSDPQKQTH